MMKRRREGCGLVLAVLALSGTGMGAVRLPALFSDHLVLQRGKPLVVYKGMTVKDGAVRIAFDSVGGGLMAGTKKGREPVVRNPDGRLERFAIAGEDRKWYWADAVIEGDAVVVSSQQVPMPVAVRYAHSANPLGANLYNAEGLPASPFRTDSW